MEERVECKEIDRSILMFKESIETLKEITELITLLNKGLIFLNDIEKERVHYLAGKVKIYLGVV